jgi:hypothetical protein
LKLPLPTLSLCCFSGEGGFIFRNSAIVIVLTMIVGHKKYMRINANKIRIWVVKCSKVWVNRLLYCTILYDITVARYTTGEWGGSAGEWEGVSWRVGGGGSAGEWVGVSWSSFNHAESNMI